MRIATWIVCMLYREGALEELVKEMYECKIDICAVQKVIWTGKRKAIERII